MVRLFGQGNQQTTLMIDQAGVEPYYTLSLVGDAARGAYGTVMRVRFGNEELTERSFLKGKLADKTPLVTMFGVNLAPPEVLHPGKGKEEAPVEPIGAAREAAIQRITMSGGLHEPITLETGFLGEPLAALQTCASDLVTYLGIGDGPNPRLSQPPVPKGNPGTWVTANDYPTAMLRQGLESVVRFRLTIDSKGVPTSCHITRSTRPQVFDDIACLALLKNGQFTPALDQEGKSVAAYWSSSIRWAIPN